MRRLFGKLWRAEEKTDTSVSLSSDSEKEYYENLFIKSGTWSSAYPNEYEYERWKHIYMMVNFVKGYFFSKNISSLSILDFGCGRGWLTFLLNKHGKATGVEPVEKVIEYGKQIFPELDLRSGSKDFLVENQNAYDLIVSSEVIEHIIDSEKENYFRAFHASIRNDGFLIITTPRAEAYEEWRKYTNPNQPVEDWITEDQVYNLAENAGFKKQDMIRYSEKPQPGSPSVEVYQVWLFKKI